jgi:hypothetical protein
MRLFHRTDKTIAERIALTGFKDGTGNYGTANRYSGVWFSDSPLDENEGATGDVVIAVELNLPDTEIDRYEWVEDLKPYREWLIPAALVNAHVVVISVTDEM